jgi:hypothetical protein
MTDDVVMLSEEEDIRADIEAAMGKEEEIKDEPVPDIDTPSPADPVPQIPDAPQSLTAEEKAEWGNLSDKARDIILRREQDYHKGITNQDSERLFGRDLKEVITPYMAAITAAGSTPKDTIGNLLNTVYRLQNGDEHTRATIVKQIAKDYGVKLEGITDGEEYVDPAFAQLQAEIARLKQQADPQVLIKQLTEQQETARIQSDIASFASNPEHVHFEAVRPLMTALITSGQAKDLKEAYDMACYANPSIRSTLEAKKAAEQQAKRKQEIDAKKRAASSISGSPATPSVSNSKMANPHDDLEADIRNALASLKSEI